MVMIKTAVAGIIRRKSSPGGDPGWRMTLRAHDIEKVRLADNSRNGDRVLAPAPDIATPVDGTDAACGLLVS